MIRGPDLEGQDTHIELAVLIFCPRVAQLGPGFLCPTHIPSRVTNVAPSHRFHASHAEALMTLNDADALMTLNHVDDMMIKIDADALMARSAHQMHTFESLGMPSALARCTVASSPSFCVPSAYPGGHPRPTRVPVVIECRADRSSSR
eukprot:2493276-Rhodomonas_salina.3